MLSDREKKGCYDLLNALPNIELLSLCDTVTSRMIKVDGRKEALKAIVTYTECPHQLLKRQKIRKDHLFQYLARSNIIVSPKTEKFVLIQTVLKSWGSAQQNVQQDDVEDELADDLDLTDNDDEAASQKPTHTQTHKETAQHLAESFVPWFYRMLNACNTHYVGEKAGECFGAVHFFRDSKLELQLCSDGHVTEKENHSGSDVISTRLATLISQQNLCLNANITAEGIRGISDPHGLVVVMACGTVHRHQECLGVYKQQFGLARDPHSDNNWKIKFTKLVLQSGAHSQQPSLENSDFPQLEY